MPNKHIIRIINGYPARCCRSHTTTMVVCSCGMKKEANDLSIHGAKTTEIILHHRLEVVMKRLGIEVPFVSENMDIKEAIALRKEMGQI